MPRLPSSPPPDPRRRYHAIAAGARRPETENERALEWLLSAAELRAQAAASGLTAPSGPRQVTSEALDGVRAAIDSFADATVRTLFDACLLGRATATELQESFGVSAHEAAAYIELFFDRAVFKNDFHVIAYIQQQTSDPVRKTLKEGFTKGFRALRYKYASASEATTASEVLERTFEADAQHYMRVQETPLTAKSAKEVRALGKHMLAAAQVLKKVAPPPPEAPRDEEAHFVLENGPANPTLDDLIAKGIEIAH